MKQKSLKDKAFLDILISYITNGAGINHKLHYNKYLNFLINL